MSKRITALALALALSVALCGCGGTEQAETEAETDAEEHDLIVVGFSQVGSESDFRVANTTSMEEALSEANGYELIFDDAQQKLENQIRAIRTFIQQNVDYIVVAPVTEVGLDEVLQEAKLAGIPVILVDRLIDTDDESLYTAFVGSDFYAEAEMATDWLEKTLSDWGRGGEEINIVDIQGPLGGSAQLGRTGGLEEAIAEHRNWHLVAQTPADYTQAKAQEVMADILAETQDIDVIYCENDNMAFGVIDALEDAGISYGVDGDVIIISFDATRAGLTACLAGEINLVVECNPLHGPRVEAIIQQLEQGETPEKITYVEEGWFTRSKLSQSLIDGRAY